MADHVKAFFVASFLVVVILTAGCPPAAAQQPLCTERSEVVNQLASQYTEAPVAMGIANNGGVVEILVAPGGASWTIILTMPNGVTCMIAAGENWETLPTLSKTAGRKS